MTGGPQALISIPSAQDEINKALAEISLHADPGSISTNIQLAPFGIFGVIEFTTMALWEGLPEDEDPAGDPMKGSELDEEMMFMDEEGV